MASARAGNVIGGGDWAEDRLIPDIVRAFSENKEVILRNPNAIRPWQHVLEPLSGYLLLTQTLVEHGQVFAQAWNFGPFNHSAKTVSWVTEYLCHLWGGDATYSIHDDSKALHEAHYLSLDCTKAYEKLSWSPRLSLEQSLQYTSSWYKSYYNGHKNMYDFTMQQIIDYENHK